MLGKSPEIIRNSWRFVVTVDVLTYTTATDKFPTGSFVSSRVAEPTFTCWRSGGPVVGPEGPHSQTCHHVRRPRARTPRALQRIRQGWFNQLPLAAQLAVHRVPVAPPGMARYDFSGYRERRSESR